MIDKMIDKKNTKQSSPGKARAPASRTKKAKPLKRSAPLFPIVGLGASAGGLQALKTFFSHVPENCGMAFIVLVHMTPKQPSMMPGLLQKVTSLPVETARDGHCIEADHIYVIPPDKEISVFRGKIQLLDVVERHSILPIDAFLRSLAQDQGPRAVAVVLSGTGTDGTLGIKEIKANDGLVLVQSETSADYDGMPRSAIATGMADIILPPEEMPRRLSQYFSLHPVTARGTALARSGQQAWLYKFLPSCAPRSDTIFPSTSSTLCCAESTAAWASTRSRATNNTSACCVKIPRKSKPCSASCSSG
ncbi:hypothetical protein DSCOOX_04680 [Desulfosarcina ovata subsp. ovata]|uniref:protein-glutamate methylesterase n=1 Tax=Desulfosarcina ovata subsp. ovata TaxID=2752305 RepID=A0A5K8A4E8_9BACT|nr:hypothetical protein DSCOOX_04680 [Desulfosarcina ovata subsp. ovata]